MAVAHGSARRGASPVALEVFFVPRPGPWITVPQTTQPNSTGFGRRMMEHTFCTMTEKEKEKEKEWTGNILLFT